MASGDVPRCVAPVALQIQYVLLQPSIAPSLNSRNTNRPTIITSSGSAILYVMVVAAKRQ